MFTLKTRIDRPTLNKAIASSILVAAMVGTMILSWIASPAPFIDIVTRSIPVMLMMLVLVLVTVTGSNVGSRILSAIFFSVLGIMYMTYFSLSEWGIAYFFIGLSIFADLGISANGCQSPMESNANDNFLVVSVVFLTGFAIGYCFELLNSMVLGWWTLAPVISYPMISLSGINLIVLFTYAFISFLLFELAMLVHMISRRILYGKEKSCTIESTGK